MAVHACLGADVPIDLPEYRAGDVALEQNGETLMSTGEMRRNKSWRAVFSAEPAKPLISSIAVTGWS